LSSFVCKILETVTVYDDCSSLANVVASLPANSSVTVTEVAGAWYKYSAGWFYIYDGVILIATQTSTTDSTVALNSYVSLNSLTSATDIYGGTINGITSTNNAFTVTQITGNSAYITNGTIGYWVSSSSLTVNPTNSNDSTAIVTITSTTDTNTGVTTSMNNSELLASYTSNYGVNTADSSEWNSLTVSSLQGIFGMPYQYMPIADIRLNNSTFGYKYAEKIVSRMPLLVMVPGIPQFLAGYSTKYKQSVVSDIIKDEVAGTSSAMNTLLQHPGKYYGLAIDWIDYFNYVNPMCRAAARFLGIQDWTYHNSKTLDSYDWQDEQNESIKAKLNYKGGIAFYINSENQVSESFTNSTGQSMIAGKINGISDLGREVNFLMGTASSLVGGALDKEVKEGQKSTDIAAADYNDKWANAWKSNPGSRISTIIGNLTNGMKTVIQGGKLIFPEIWNDSSFSRDYEISVKLVSPDCDITSLYINIIVPLIHLVCFTAPRSVSTNGYASPFLVRAFYKGMFNCDMGIITSLSINKGSEGCWSPAGIPTAVDVQFTIKELYGTMSISNNAGNLENGLLNNITLMDYLANMCGININEPDFKRMLYFYYSMNYVDKWKDLVKMNTIEATDQWFTSFMYNWYIGRK
jgi:hypothetical protein